MSILTSPGATKSLKLLHIRKSGPDIVGSMESRGKMFEYADMMSSSEDEDEDKDILGGSEEDTEADIANFRSSAFSVAASRIRDATPNADLEAMHELTQLPRNLLPFAR